MANQSNMDPPQDASAGDGTPQDPAGLGPQGATKEEGGKTPVTLADLKAHKAEVQALMSTQYRGIQSLLDRQSGNLKAALEPVNRITAQLKGMGFEVTPEQEEELRQAEVMRTLTGGGEEIDKNGNPAQPGQVPDKSTPAGDQPGSLESLAIDMMRERGVVILATDAELSLIDQETKDPKVFLDSVELAITTKIQRLANPETDTGDGETDVRPKGPGLNPRGSGNKSSNILPEKTPGGNRTSSQDYLQAGFQESGVFK